MSKERKALQKFLDDYLALCEKLHTNQQEKMLLDKNSPYNVLKTYLESIDNAKPSEALNITKATEKYTGIDLSIIKQALLKSQEQEKVLKIIKEKNVDIIRIRHLIFKSQKNPKYWDLRYYNEARVIDNDKLTQEEFELLKRYFNEQNN